MTPLNFIKTYKVFLIIVLAVTYGQAQEWKLKRDKNGIKIYTRKLDSTKLCEYKAVMLIKASVHEALQTITDGNHLKKWNYKTSESRIVKKISENELIIWMKNDFTWPVKNRDHVSRLKIAPYKGSGYRIEVTSENTEIVPRKRSMIRITNFKGYWQLIPKDDYVEVTQQIYGDPEGFLPNWLVNSVLTTAPYHSFYNLKELLEK